MMSWVRAAMSRNAIATTAPIAVAAKPVMPPIKAKYRFCLLAPTKAPYPLISRKIVTPIRIDQKTRPPHPEPENRANQERAGAADEVNGSGMEISCFVDSIFSADPDSDRT
ncbi:hypothetical protein EMIT0P395_90136 [Pseudomonas sp. IT-P395]